MEETFNPQPEFTELKKPFLLFPFSNQMQPLLLLLIIGFVFYSTSLHNEYALDDGILIHQNEYVIKGVEGIPDILAKDAYHSFYKRMNATDQLQGGRYRPIAGITFALEQQLIHPYRSGLYMRVEDLNQNGVLDNKEVSYRSMTGDLRRGFEFNEYIDANGDGSAQANECYACWDLNQNFHNDMDEDLNVDGVFNEVDCQVYGSAIRHFNNIWLYVLGALLLYILFRDHFFPENQDIAFLGGLIFLTHPVHSEVVANIRGREDIFSLIFISLTFIFSFRYIKSKSLYHLVVAGMMLFLALMSKEYGVLMFILVPLGIYIFQKEKSDSFGFVLPAVCFIGISLSMIFVDMYFDKLKENSLFFLLAGPVVFLILLFTAFGSILKNGGINALMVSLYGFGILYLLLRLNATSMAPGVPDTEILNNPFLLASGEEEFATKMYALLKYFSLLWFPHPLISDYSYNGLEYIHFTDKAFILSALLHLTLLVSGIWLSVKRHALGFAIIVYLLFLFIVSNIPFLTGTMMLEAHLFHASIGFSMAVAWLMVKGLSAISDFSLLAKRSVLFVVLLPVLFLFGCKAWERNADWKNDVTLFLKDVNNAPNSVLVLGNAGARWIDLADTKEITGIALPGQDNTQFNDYNGTLNITDAEVKAGGYKNKREAALGKGIKYLLHAVELHPRFVNGFLNLGLAYFKLGEYKKATFYWKLAERLYPHNPYLQNYYIVYKNHLKNTGQKFFDEGKYSESAESYALFTIVDPLDAEGWYLRGGAYYNMGNRQAAKICWKRALNLNSSYSEARNALEILEKGVIEVNK